MFTVFATVTAMLVPAVAAGAQVEDHECEEDHYDATNPAHVLYGRTAGTPVVGGYMVVDLSGEASGRVVFWDDVFSVDPDGGLAVGAFITGTNFNDIICGTDGDDWIFGRQGNDRIFGMFNDSGYTAPAAGPPAVAEAWGDNLFGNKGNDFITPGDGTGLGDVGGDSAQIGGGQGNDLLYASNDGSDWVRGGMHNDTIFGGFGDDQILRGGAGDDYVNARNGDDTLAEGSAGNDTVLGGGGDNQILNGNNGDDFVLGGEGDYQRLFGGAGNDHLTAGTGFADWTQALFGGAGNDTIDGQAGSSAFWAFGGAGDDMVFGGPDDDNLFGDYPSSAGETPRGPAWAAGYPAGFAQPYPVAPAVTGNDWLEGGVGLDDIFGGPGNDTIYGNNPKDGPPNANLDVADGDEDWLFGNDGDDVLLGNGASCGTDLDDVDGGANHVAGDTSRGFVLAEATNVENVFDQTPGCVAGP